MKVRLLQGLFAKAVVILFVISMVPVLVIGYRTMKINSRLLKNELLQKQKMVGERLSFTISNALTAQEQLLAEFGALHTHHENYSSVSVHDLNYLRQQLPSLFYISILSPTNNLLFEEGTRPVASFLSVRDTLMRTSLNGGRFVSDVYYDQQGAPFIWLTEPLYAAQSSQVVSVLAMAIYLDQILQNLLQIYPLDMEAVLVSTDGQILSYNGGLDEIDTLQLNSLQQKIQTLKTQLNNQESAEVKLEKNKKVLATVVQIPRMNWSIYLWQPEDVVPQLFVDSFFHSSIGDIAVVMLVMILFVGVVSYLVIIPITRPLARLRAAAVRLQEDENFVVRSSDVEIPNNEIGDLARAFVDLSQTLNTRRKELIKTQHELTHMNQVLEQKVEERTRELKIATQELVKTERLAAIGKMASIISHEIRNPLAVISNATRLIKTLVQPKEQKLSKQFNIIEGEVRQANSIINEVLGYARTREMIFSTVEVNSYLRDLLLSFPMPAHIKVVEQFDTESVRVKVDAEEIKQALRNIITNAVEAMPVGGTLTVGSRVGRKVVCIYIKDTGPGLTEEVRREMFSPFFTTKARGTGLGLAVVSKAMARHKGKLFIDSTLGKGTCFLIYLKIYRKLGDTNYGEAS